MDSAAKRRAEESAKHQFLLTGFTQAAGIRTYAFEGRVARRMRSRAGSGTEVRVAVPFDVARQP